MAQRATAGEATSSPALREARSRLKLLETAVMEATQLRGGEGADGRVLANMLQAFRAECLGLKLRLDGMELDRHEGAVGSSTRA